MEEDYLSQPLLPSTPTTTIADKDDADKFLSPTTSIFSRLLSVIFIGIISVWANYEASKGFDVTIINDSKDTLAGKRFQLLYVSNDKATRILLNTSAFVENILYPDSNHTKKQVHRVVLCLASGNPNHLVTVETNKSDEFVINVSPSIMEHTNVNYAIISALQRAMARIWLWDGESTAPPWLMDGLVEYISMLAGLGRGKGFIGGNLPEFTHRCWDDKDPKAVELFLDYCEEQNKGFIRQLNQALRERWDNRTVDGIDALGMEAKYLCDSFKKIK